MSRHQKRRLVVCLPCFLSVPCNTGKVGSMWSFQLFPCVRLLLPHGPHSVIAPRRRQRPGNERFVSRLRSLLGKSLKHTHYCVPLFLTRFISITGPRPASTHQVHSSMYVRGGTSCHPVAFRRPLDATERGYVGVRVWSSSLPSVFAICITVTPSGRKDSSEPQANQSRTIRSGSTLGNNARDPVTLDRRLGRKGLRFP
ncbi:uncharacterized protein B0T23DRAFT_369723 [Neurospora hispaniola]|uniref:Uncharacterized protein n=1 Tax=Neurospora hispaniola TaxID=588809 RepID=A0AAJ0IFQ3_9PEZI|nr:hypothetical protein B0T23DRAFT_369723 [Neurospora hispaniola]